MAKMIFTKEPNLLYEKDFKEIEITKEISANTHKSIAKNSMITKIIDGEKQSVFSKEEYQLNMVSSCCKFDGKQFSPLEVSRFEKEFFTKIFLHLIPDGEEDSQSQENLED